MKQRLDDEGRHYLRKMMIEHYGKTLPEWLEALPLVEKEDVEAVFNGIRRDELTIGEIEEAHRW